MDRSGQDQTIKIKLRDISQLFETLDPFPFHERNLAKDAEEYITDRAKELAPDAPLHLIVYLPDQGNGLPAAADLQASISAYFSYRAGLVRRELHDLLSVGRRALLVGLATLGVCLVIGQLLSALLSPAGIAHFFEEGLIIVGWVALWRPFEIFFYDWWPIARERKLLERLSQSIVSIEAYTDKETDS